MAQKPFSEKNGFSNVLKHGVGAVNIDGCRVEVHDAAYARNCSGDRGHADNRKRDMDFALTAGSANEIGRWPANLIHDGSEDVIACFPAEAGTVAPVHTRSADKFQNTYGAFKGDVDEAGSTFRGDSGSAARFFNAFPPDADPFFYCPKATKADRAGSRHPTVKPITLMRWLCRLVTPPGGTVLDPFAGSGTTGQAAREEGFASILIEREIEYMLDASRRFMLAPSSSPLSREILDLLDVPAGDDDLIG